MVKLLVFAILLASSPATGLIETLFNTENKCYSDCHSNNAVTTNHVGACKKGCDFKLQNEDCANQCLSFSTNPEIQNSCQVGCTLSQPVPNGGVVGNKPVVAVNPVPEVNVQESERPRSIILIRLRQRPSFGMPSIQMPSPQSFFNDDPIQFFNKIIKQFQEKANELEQSVHKSFDENAKDLAKPPEFGAVQRLVQHIPMIRFPGNVRADSSSESSEEANGKRPLLDEFKHIIKHPHEHEQYLRERMAPVNNRVQQFFSNIRAEWNDLVRRQPKIPIWIFLGILLSSSAILWYMVMSLCRHTPSRDLSVRAQELVFHPYGYDGYEKEKIQPDEQPYEVTESLPIKVKLSNI